MRIAKGMRKALEPPHTVHCVCGKLPIVVHNGSRKALSCPNPLRCEGGLMTGWYSTEEAARDRWALLVAQWRHSL